MKIEIKNLFNCQIIHSGEYNTLREALAYCISQNIHLRDADLSGAYLRDADLSGAYLRGADLLNGKGKIPAIQNIHQVVYAAAAEPEALDMLDWHTCETTHCRAGWVVTLAGAAGAAMEFCLGTPAAAALIYQASDPTMRRIPNFYCDNEKALADMKRLAELEAGR